MIQHRSPAQALENRVEVAAVPAVDQADRARHPHFYDGATFSLRKRAIGELRSENVIAFENNIARRGTICGASNLTRVPYVSHNPRPSCGRRPGWKVRKAKSGGNDKRAAKGARRSPMRQCDDNVFLKMPFAVNIWSAIGRRRTTGVHVTGWAAAGREIG